MSIYSHYAWLVILGIGFIVSAMTYSFVLEAISVEGKGVNNLTFVLITATVNSVVGFVFQRVFGGTTANISEYKLLELVFASFCATWTVIHSLKFVIYPVQILFKSCRTLPVRLTSVILGREVSFQSVDLIFVGVLLVIGNSENVFLGK
jgi:UDP-galactose transporter B1